MNQYVQEISKLREENDELECEIHFLRKALEHIDARFHSLGLTPNEARLLQILFDASPRVVGKDRLINAITAHYDAPHKGLQVYCHRLRKKLPAGCELKLVYGIGYMLPKETKDILAGVIESEGAI